MFGATSPDEIGSATCDDWTSTASTNRGLSTWTPDLQPSTSTGCSGTTRLLCLER